MRTTIVILVCLSFAVPCAADTIIVDANGSADYDTIQEAIDYAGNGDVVEVRPGTYYEQINFYGKAIIVKSTDPNDMGVVYSTTINGGTADNTVTFDSGEDANSLLLGITVENGNIGIYCYYSDPTIRKCVIKYTNDSGGAGIYGYDAQPIIEDCIIRENAGDGIYNCDGQITNCEVRENFGNGINNCDGLISKCTVADNSGDGLYDCDGEIKQCTITGNTVGLNRCADGQIKECIVNNNSGHGIRTYGGTGLNVEILNCIVSGNRGHGIYLYSSYSMTGRVINCTIAGNKESGVRIHGNFSSFLSNNIVVNNGVYGINNSSNGIITLKYNNLWNNTSGNYTGLPPGQTDTHSNSLFAIDGYWDIDDEWVEGDYHLKSIAGRWTDTGWVNDAVTSLCIDAGDPTSGSPLETEPNGDRINQGVYGGTEYASKSPYGPDPYCSQYPEGDLNWDCKIDFLDFAKMASGWLECNLVPQNACWE